MRGERGAFHVTKRLNKRRGCFEIIAEVLDASYHTAKKTDLLSKCNMSFSQFEKYLDLVLSAQLIVVENDEHRLLFKMSDKGKSFLRAYERLEALLE
ncbi:MAG: hypothetical protein OEZ25_02600 [Candidatus Bathyarchaeota archaeon]|nr:hypothetical protein [Candidatus Bathyarchaeota archaeon]